MSFYCTSISGEATWVSDKFRTSRAGEVSVQPGPSGVQVNPLKRGLDNTADGEGMETEEGGIAEASTEDAEIKKAKNEDVNNSGSSSVTNGKNQSASIFSSDNRLNLPLGGRGKGAVVKMYRVRS